MPSTRDQPRREPAFNMPGIVATAVAALVAIHALRQALSASTDLGLLLDFAFVPAQWSTSLGFASADDVLTAAGRGDDAELVSLRQALARFFAGHGDWKPWSCLTYALLHGSWLHVGLNGVWLAAFGTPVVRRAGTARTALVAVATTLGGAGAQWLADPLAVQPMIGASAAVSGLMGAAVTFMFATARAAPGAWDVRGGTWSFLANGRALTFLALWLLMNLVFGALAEPLGITAGSIAWQAHMGGLAVGLALFPLIDPARGRSAAFERGA